MKSQRFRKIVCWMTGMTLFFCLPFLPAMAEFYYVENEWNYVDGSMDISCGIPENATGVMDRIRRKGVLRPVIRENVPDGKARGLAAFFLIQGDLTSHTIPLLPINRFTGCADAESRTG